MSSDIIKDKVSNLSDLSKANLKSLMSQLTSDNVTSELLNSIDRLTDEEYETLKLILQESLGGEFSTIDSLVMADYEEVPVDILTFLSDPDYLGLSTDNGEGIYDYWKNSLKEIFEPRSTVVEVAFSGCFTGDTMIPLMSGEVVSIEDIVNRFERDRLSRIYTYSYNLDYEEYHPGLVEGVFRNGVKDVYKVTLDNGKVIKCTSNHKFLTRNKKWVSIDSGKLKEGTSLMPFSRSYDEKGYEIIKNPKTKGDSTRIKTHRLSMKWKLLMKDYRGVVHHRDFNKTNNDPENLCLIKRWSVHQMYHARRGSERRS